MPAIRKLTAKTADNVRLAPRLAAGFDESAGFLWIRKTLPDKLRKEFIPKMSDLHHCLADIIKWIKKPYPLRIDAGKAPSGRVRAVSDSGGSVVATTKP